MGTMAGPTTGAAGLGESPGWVTYAPVDAGSIAHELGHNFSLDHAPCGTVGDPGFPTGDGSIGSWGYDFRDGGSVVPPNRKDVMSYCGPIWISDYHFTNALNHRLSTTYQASISSTGTGKSLLLWGGVHAEGKPFLKPSFVVEAPPALPDSSGAYELTGWTADGQRLFSFSFTMPQVADGGGRSSFAFVLPVQVGWADSLASIVLSGSGGSFTLDGDSDDPRAIVRDPQSGQVRAFLSGSEVRARMRGGTAVEFGFEVLLSRGIPDRAAWRR